MTRSHQIHRWLPLLLLLATGRAFADAKYVIRMATIAPEGTSWAHEVKAFGREVETATHGEVQVKWYFGGIAGDDLQVQTRIERGQLDGAASGGMLCMRAAPSMRLMRVPGLFDSRDEAAHVMSRLKPIFDEEFHRSGFVHLMSTGLGQDMVFSRQPIRSLEELRHTRFWRWSLDEPAALTDTGLELQTLPLPLDEAAQAYDDRRVDGFLIIPSATLAFQLYIRARYMTQLRLGFLWGCVIVSNRAWDRLPLEDQQVLRAAAVKLGRRVEQVGRQMDDQLLGGLFEKQGLINVPLSASFRAEFLSAARAVRDQLRDKLVRPAILQQTLAILADYRAEHPSLK